MSASTSISGMTELAAAPASNDWLVIVDISDSSMAATGTDKKISVANVFTSPVFAGTVTTTAEVVRPDQTSYQRIWGGTVAGGAANIFLGGSGYSAGSRNTISIGTISPSSPGTTDGTVAIATSGGTTRMMRDGSWQFPAGVDLVGAAPTAAASHVAIGGSVRTTIGANGAAAALTALPLGYLDINVAGTIAQIPYYARGA